MEIERATFELATLYRKYIKTSHTCYRAVLKLQVRLSRYPYEKEIKIPTRPHKQPYLPHLTEHDRGDLDALRAYFDGYETDDPLLRYVLRHVADSIEEFITLFGGVADGR